MSEQPGLPRRSGSSDNRMVPGSAREVEFRAKNRSQALRGAIDFYAERGSPVNPEDVLTTADVFLSWLEKP